MTADSPSIASLADRIEAAETVLPAGELSLTIAFFQERLGFRLESIFPADDPQTAVLSGPGTTIRLERGAQGTAGHLRMLSHTLNREEELQAPNGTRITLAPLSPVMAIPPLNPATVISEVTETVTFNPGRAGMGYRDLVPDRLGGRFIASHIRIADGGPVPDYVHYHQVRFQMIYCHKGWVKVVYEDQGDPITMHPGDCVLQPPEIRHQVLECSDGMEVIEIGCPADHITMVEHELPLPNGVGDPERRWSGQRFIFHRAAKAQWGPSAIPGFEARDTKIGWATDGLAGVQTLRAAGKPGPTPINHQAEFLFFFVLEGALILAVDEGPPKTLAAGSSVTLPGGTRFSLTPHDERLRLLQVSLPDEIAFS